MMYLDHIAISAVTLEEATDHVQSALGVTLQPGGQHATFGTHNTLLGLEDGLYLEAISNDPQAEKPARPRWFNLDRVSGPPKLSNWICRTDGLTDLLAALPAGAGQPVALRRGDLSWDMAVPGDGALPYDNLHPALIQWHGALHPAQMLAPSGCRLRRLTIRHPQAEALGALLSPHLQDDRLSYEPAPAPALAAEFDTPSGPRTLM